MRKNLHPFDFYATFAPVVMKIGTWSEVWRGDSHLLLCLRELSCEGLVEQGAGEGMRLSNAQLEEAGAKLIERAPQAVEEAKGTRVLGYAFFV